MQMLLPRLKFFHCLSQSTGTEVPMSLIDWVFIIRALFYPVFFSYKLELCQITMHCPKTPCYLIFLHALGKLSSPLRRKPPDPPSLPLHPVKVCSLNAQIKHHLLFKNFSEPLRQIQSTPRLLSHRILYTPLSQQSSFSMASLFSLYASPRAES